MFFKVFLKNFPIFVQAKFEKYFFDLSMNVLKVISAKKMKSLHSE
jgi:hypothetical protein